MGAIKNNLDSFPDHESFDQGASFGRHVREQELLPVLKAALAIIMHPTVHVRRELRYRQLLAVQGLTDAIAAIESPPAPPAPTLPTDDESVNF